MPSSNGTKARKVGHKGYRSDHVGLNMRTAHLSVPPATMEAINLAQLRGVGLQLAHEPPSTPVTSEASELEYRMDVRNSAAFLRLAQLKNKLIPALSGATAAKQCTAMYLEEEVTQITALMAMELKLMKEATERKDLAESSRAATPVSSYLDDETAEELVQRLVREQEDEWESEGEEGEPRISVEELEKMLDEPTSCPVP